MQVRQRPLCDANAGKSGKNKIDAVSFSFKLYCGSWGCRADEATLSLPIEYMTGQYNSCYANGYERPRLPPVDSVVCRTAPPRFPEKILILL